MLTDRESVTPSPRQIDVLRLVTAAHSDKETSARLGISIHTVRQHLRSVSHAVGLSTRGELVRWVMQHPEALRGEAADRELHEARQSCICPYCMVLA